MESRSGWGGGMQGGGMRHLSSARIDFCDACGATCIAMCVYNILAEHFANLSRAFRASFGQ